MRASTFSLFGFIACALMAGPASASDQPITPSKPIILDPISTTDAVVAKPAHSASAASKKASKSSSASARAAAKLAAEAEEEAKAAAEKEAAAKEAAAKEAAAKQVSLAAKEEAERKEVAEKIATKLAAIRKAKARRMAEAKAKAAAEPHAEDIHARAAMAGHASHWSYEGEAGPNQWAKLDPAWNTCASGTRQSPIDIRDGIKVDLEQVSFDYKPTYFNVLDNGHTIQVGVGAGNSITVTGRRYELAQLHFHRPSEERVNGRRFDMVAHLVHKDADGRLAVVALLIEDGKTNLLLQNIWNNLPLEKNDPVSAANPINLSEVIPAKRDYYTYMGSLTTPPCSEGVLWIVFKQPIEMSAYQIGIFSRLYPMNARPIQSPAGRLIKESN